MHSEIVFRDLAGPVTELDDEDKTWLREEVLPIDPSKYVVRLPGARGTADDDDDLPLIWERTPGDFVAGRFVGDLRIGDRRLRIEPRLGFPTLASWLGYAMNVPIIPRSASTSTSDLIVPYLLAAIWSASVADAARHAPPSLRVEQTEVSRVLKGRLDISGTVRLRAKGFRDRVSIRTRERSLTNDLARVLVRADWVLHRSLKDQNKDWRPPLVRDLIVELRTAVGSSPELPTERTLRRIRYTPITAKYRDAARLSSIVARNQGLLSSNDDQRSAGMLLDVAEIWELFLLHCARYEFGSSNIDHAARTEGDIHLLRSEITGRRLGRVRPDIVLSDDDRVLAVFDAKYKRLVRSQFRRDGVERSDLYQLTSYTAIPPGPEIGALVYPPDPDNLTASPAEAEGPWRSANQARIFFLRVSADREECARQLRDLVGGLP